MIPVAFILVVAALMVVSGSAAAAPPAGTAPAASAPLAVGLTTHLTVAPYSPARSNSPTLLALGAGCCSWNSTNEGWFENTSVQVLRWPDGTNAEGLNWTTNDQFPGGSPSDYSVGDFVTQCKAVDCKAIVQLPFEIDSPSTAAYYVSYMENTLGYTPAYWELGNEPFDWDHFGCAWADWSTSCASGNNATPTTYTAALTNYIAAIRAVDPTTPISCLASSGESLAADAENMKAWVTTIYRTEGANCQAISVHVEPIGGGGYSVSDQGFYHQIQHGVNGNLTDWVDQVFAGIAAGCGAPCAGAQVLCTECNMAGGNPANADFANQLDGFPEVLATAAEISIGLKVGLSVYTFFDFANGAHENWVTGYGHCSVPRCYLQQVYYLYSAILKNMPLTVSGAAQLRVTQTEGPGQVYYLSTEWGSQWTLLIANLNVSYSADITFTGSGFPTSGAYKFYEWNNNSTKYPVTSTGTSLTTYDLPTESLLMVNVTASGGGPTVPPAPTSLTIGAITTTTATAYWVQSTGGGILNDTAFLYGGGSCGTVLNGYSTGGTAVSHEFTVLADGTRYSSAIAGWNGTGMSALSTCVGFTTLGVYSPTVPPAPTSISVSSVTVSSVLWDWVQSIGGGILNDTLRVYEGSSCSGSASLHSTGGPATSKNVTGLSASTSYSAIVTSWNITGQSPGSSCKAATTSAVVPPSPPAPAPPTPSTTAYDLGIGIALLIVFLIIAALYSGSRGGR